MGFPAGMQLATIAFGIPLTATGKEVVTHVTVKPTARVIWAATGQPLPEFADSFTAEAGQLGSFQVPFIDQAGFIDSTGAAVTDFAYQITADWSYGNERPITWSKNIKPLVGQTGTIDLDLVPDGPVSIPVTAPTAAVLGFGGRTGFVTLQESDLPARLSVDQLSATFVPKWKATTAYLAGDAVLNPSGDTVTAKVNFTSGASYNAANWNLSTSYANIAAGRIGPRWLFLGDSITAGSVTSDQAYWSGAFAVQASLLSKGQITMVRDAGISGNTTAQIDARFATDVTPYASQVDAVFLLAGTNDSAVTAIATWIASMKSIIGKIRTLGKQPIMSTIPPNDGGGARPAAITAQNAWIRRYAGQNGIPLVDFYKVMVNQTTGGYITGYTGDATHPNAAGRAAMATALVSTLQPLLSPSPAIIPMDNNDPNNLLTNGCFANWTTPITPPTVTPSTVATGGTLTAGTYYYKVTILNYQGESLPTAEVSVAITAGQKPQLSIPAVGGNRVLNIYRSATAGAEVLLATNVATGSPAIWADDGTLTPGSTTVPSVDYTTAPTGWGGTTAGPAQLSKVTDAAVQGFAARFAATGTQRGQGQNVAMSGKFSVGDTLALVGVVRSGLQAPTLLYRFNGGAAPNAHTLVGDAATAWGPGVFYKEVIVPTGTTSLDVYFQNDASATGTCDFGQLGVYNLTTLGIL